ncbi:aspartate aminotransferase family protein [Aquamicrobium sp.]|uniref:aspartate aminotransferase family protein n=1 Tax=Aquamicrobium sp. TaxID=1872579 RepID=UPI002583F28F|nr:aspartate aminotransferase family protein [Aquamicrobium sp.]MCK9552580.1 aspartate aminotransferase family protein [Aquamicrobium sp.]
MTTHVFHRALKSALPYVAGGDGITLRDAEGRTYIDACGGAAVSCLGHGHPAVLEAMAAQAKQAAYIHTSFFTTEAAEKLAARVAENCGGDLNHVYFVDSGSEATETALKMARQYWLERGQPQRTKVISRHFSYHGNTLGALSVSGNRWRREPYAPLLADASFIEPCFFYRHAGPGETPEAYGARAAAALEKQIVELGPETVMAFIAETVVGATTGAVAPAPGYLKRIREICDRHGVLLILDEVMCGAGRTGTFLAAHAEGVAADIVTLAKGLGGGYQAIAAVICSDKVYEGFYNGSGVFQHGLTYSAHPVACAASLAVQEVILRDDLLANVRARGEDLNRALHGRFGNNHHVGDIRGRGLIQAIELVRDRAEKSPFDPALKLNQRIRAEAFARGLMVYPGAGCVDGRAGDHILLAPPYIVTPADIEEIVSRLGEAVDAALAAVN